MMLGFLGTRAGAAALGAISSSSAWGMLVKRLFTMAQQNPTIAHSVVTATGVVVAQTRPAKEAADSLFGDSDEELKEEIVSQVEKWVREGDFLVPTRRDGSPITPNYYILDLNNGHQWFIEKYNSYKVVQSAARRASFRSNRKYHARGVHPRGRYSRR